MVTGYEVQMYQDINSIARHLNRIANCMEAEEKRQRLEETGLNGLCGEKECVNQAVVAINGMRYCADHLDAGFSRVQQIAQKAMRVMGPEEGEQ